MAFKRQETLSRKQTKQQQKDAFWEVVGLDEDDMVTTNHINAFNLIRESRYDLKMVGTPKEGDMVIERLKIVIYTHISCRILDSNKLLD